MNYLDYLDWRGDLSFAQDEYNLVDGLLMAYLVYTDLEGIVPGDGMSVTIREAAERFFEGHQEKELKKNKSFVAVAPFVLRKMAESERFGHLKLHHYVKDVDVETSHQFSVVQADISEDTTVIAYCGTDDTLVGWKEDFQMSYKEILSQKLAVNYLNQKTDPDRRYYLCGHSKGGNLALYSACKCDKEIQERLIRIDDYDGPGLNPELFDLQEKNAIMDRYNKIVPESSVFGMIFNNEENLHVVDSTGVFVLQHAGETWQVMGKEFKPAEQLSTASTLVEEILTQFLKEVPPTQREAYVETLFDSLEEEGIHTIVEFQTNGVHSIIKAVKAIHENEELYKEVNDVFMDTVMSTVRTEAVQSVKEEFRKRFPFMDKKDDEEKEDENS